MKRSVLVTGGCGFVGSVLVNILLVEGFRVRVLDNLMYGNSVPAGIKAHPDFEFMTGDIRKSHNLNAALDGIDNVVHLAAIVGDPACKKDPKTAQEINLDASLNLFAKARKYGVQKFIFSSTCSNYGKMQDANGCVNENSPLRPISLYAQLKVQVEEHIISSPKDAVFTPVVLRFATAYGVSPRMRFDLTVNEFTKELALGRELVVFGEQFWRPYCHSSDLARACIQVLNAKKELVDNNVFNVGSTEENYQKQMIIDCIGKQIPRIRVKYVKKDEDPRDYKVDFSKIKKELGFNAKLSVPEGIKEIREAINNNNYADPDAALYKNI